MPNNVLSCESTSDKLKVIWILHSFFQIMLLAIDELSKRYSCFWNRIFPTRWNNLNHLKSFIVMQRLFFIFHWKFSLTESCHKYFNKFLLGKGCFLVRHKLFKRVMPSSIIFFIFLKPGEKNYLPTISREEDITSMKMGQRYFTGIVSLAICSIWMFGEALNGKKLTKWGILSDKIEKFSLYTINCA